MVEDTSLCFNAYKGLPGKQLLPICYALCLNALASTNLAQSTGTTKTLTIAAIALVLAMTAANLATASMWCF